MSTDRHAKGSEVRRQVLGDAHVDRSEEGRTELNAPFLDLVTEGAWGTVWASDALSHRERSMITLALLAGLGNWQEFELHLRATKRTGASQKDITQVLMHVAIYAGVPRANHAFSLAKRVLSEGEGPAE